MALGTSLALALWAAYVAQSACPAFPSDPSVLIPDSASAVLGVDVDAFAKTSTGRALLPALRADLQIAEALEVSEECGLELDRTYALTLARDGADGRVAIVQSRGVGAPQALACIAGELRARSDGSDPWAERDGSCGRVLDLSDHSRAWVVNDFTLVWARGAFVDAVGDRLEGRAPMTLPAGLADEFARLDRSGQLWLAAVLDDEDRQTLPGVWAQRADSLTASVDLSEGLRGVFSLSAPDVGAVANVRDLVLASFAALADRLDDYGVDHRLRERARVGIVDGVVAVQVELDEGELRQLRARIGAHVDGRGPL